MTYVEDWRLVGATVTGMAEATAVRSNSFALECREARRGKLIGAAPSTTRPDRHLPARGHLGLQGTGAGRMNSTVQPEKAWIEQGFKRLGTKIVGIVYDRDSTPWCGLFVSECLAAAGIDLSAMKVGVRASAWATWGQPVTPARLAAGTILVFQRPGGGHVGFYIGEDATAYHVLGGNQGDRVSITRITKERCYVWRWPKGRLVIGKPVVLAAAGGVSGNEA